MTPEWDRLTAALRVLDEGGHAYALVGEDPSTLVREVSGDVDVVVGLHTIRGIDRVASEIGTCIHAALVQCLRHEQAAYYYVFCWSEGETVHYLRLDFCHEYLRDARPLMTGDELLDGRTRDPGSGLYLPAPGKKLLYYLLKKTDKGAVNKDQFGYLTRCLAECDRDMLPEFSRFWPSHKARRIMEVLKQDDVEAFQSMVPDLQRALKGRRRRTPASYAGELSRVIHRILGPTGVWIAVYGPDGCGKSSVIRALKPSLLPAFRRTAESHFRPYVGYPERADGVTVPDPHGQRMRRPLTSMIKLFYYANDYILGYLLRVFPALVRSTFVVFDRYYDDLLVDRRRYCYGGPEWLLKAVRPLIPKPHLVFCLDAPAEVLQSRKQEVPIEETVRQREAYRELVLGLSNGHVIDASKPLQNVVRDVQRIVLDYMAERTKCRMKRHG